MRFRYSSIFLLLLLVPALVVAREAKEQARIEFLIHGVETSSGLTFIRNGSAHDPAAAAKHLRRKLDYAGERLKTAEDFVKYCASESSLTHQKYKVRTADGTTVEAAEYFADRLREFDHQKP